MNHVSVEGTAYFHTASKQPKLKRSGTGLAILSFSVGFYQGKDKDKGFIGVTCFGDLAENVASSLLRTSNVVVSGRLDHHKWVDDDGVTRSKLSIVAEDVGKSMRWLPAHEPGIPRDGEPLTGSAEAAVVRELGEIPPDEAPF